MGVFLVGYDLHEGENYGGLERAIVALCPDYWHCLDSTWLVAYSGDAGDLGRALLPHLKGWDREETKMARGGDKLLVAAVSAPAWTPSFPKECRDWLNSHFS